MLIKFDIYTDHYALQWLKSMKTGSALIHCWSVALEEFDFTILHCPGKDQGHGDGMSRLPIESAPLDGEEAALTIQHLAEEEAAQTQSGGSTSLPMWGVGGGDDALWKLFRDRFSYSGARKFVLRFVSCRHYRGS